MKGRTVIILCLVAGALAGMVRVQKLLMQRQRAQPHERAGQSLFEGLDVNSVAKIVVSGPGNTATVARVEGNWVCADRYNYPADFGKIRETLLGLSEMKAGQVVKVDASQRKALGMVPPAAGEDAGTVIALFGADDKPLGELLVGETRYHKSEGPGGGYPNGQYVSTDQGATVCLIKDPVSHANADPAYWLDEDLVSVSGSEVAMVTLTDTNGHTLVVRRGKDNSLELEGLKEDETMDSSRLYGVESALSYFRMDSIADPDLDDTALGFDRHAVYESVTRKGEVYTVILGGPATGSDGRHARLRVDYKRPPAPPGTLDEKSAAEQEKEYAATEKRVKELNARLGGWTYIIASYKAEAMTRSRSDLVKKKEEKKEKDDDAPDTGKKDEK